MKNVRTKINFEENIFLEIKNNLKGFLDQSKYDQISSKIGNIKELMKEFNKSEDFYKKIRFVKSMHKKLSFVQKKLPKSKRYVIFPLSIIANKMFGCCQSYFYQENRDASLGDDCAEFDCSKDSN